MLLQFNAKRSSQAQFCKVSNPQVLPVLLFILWPSAHNRKPSDLAGIIVRA